MKSILVLGILGFSIAASAHPLGAGRYPSSRIRPEVQHQVIQMTEQLVKQMAKQEDTSGKFRDLATYIEKQIGFLMSAPGNRPYFEGVPAIRVHILPSPEVNAFATATGDIYVYLGIIPYFKHQDLLLGVLGHELAHVSRAHIQRLLQQYWGHIPHDDAAVSSEFLGKILIKIAQTAKNVGLAALVQSTKRVHESEADQVGMELLQNAGVSPRYFRFAMNAMQRFSPHPDPEHPTPLQRLAVIFQDHPTTPYRIENAEHEMEAHRYLDHHQKRTLDPQYLQMTKDVREYLASGPRQALPIAPTH